jgi:hypothetical protein
LGFEIDLRESLESVESCWNSWARQWRFVEVTLGTGGNAWSKGWWDDVCVPCSSTETYKKPGRKDLVLGGTRSWLLLGSFGQICDCVEKMGVSCWCWERGCQLVLERNEIDLWWLACGLVVAVATSLQTWSWGIEERMWHLCEVEKMGSVAVWLDRFWLKKKNKKKNDGLGWIIFFCGRGVEKVLFLKFFFFFVNVFF